MLSNGLTGYRFVQNPSYIDHFKGTHHERATLSEVGSSYSEAFLMVFGVSMYQTLASKTCACVCVCVCVLVKCFTACMRSNTSQ